MASYYKRNGMDLTKKNTLPDGTDANRLWLTLLCLARNDIFSGIKSLDDLLKAEVKVKEESKEETFKQQAEYLLQWIRVNKRIPENTPALTHVQSNTRLRTIYANIVADSRMGVIPENCMEMRENVRPQVLSLIAEGKRERKEEKYKKQIQVLKTYMREKGYKNRIGRGDHAVMPGTQKKYRDFLAKVKREYPELLDL